MPRIDEPVPEGAIALPLVGKRAKGLCTWVSAWRAKELEGMVFSLLYAAGRDKPTSAMARCCDGVWHKQAHLHRVLFPHWPMIDHAMGDVTDNRDHMLRLATHSQNNSNVLKKKRGGRSSTPFRGVRRKSSGKFQSAVAHNRRTMYIGTFDTAEEAARAYDAKAVELHGEFAVVNFPDEHPILWRHP